MFFKAFICAMATSAVVVNAGAAVFTATREVNTITDVAPFIVKATTTVVWTQSPSTVIAEPTGPGL
ncbi:hypothetical protein C8J57DRAFT_1711921 [Mycena rebaudengoi]|nr:hypothetical protein C8J57DRAFT_1711921 [Mycena rebaudengoi]